MFRGAAPARKVTSRHLDEHTNSRASLQVSTDCAPDPLDQHGLLGSGSSLPTVKGRRRRPGGRRLFAQGRVKTASALSRRSVCSNRLSKRQHQRSHWLYWRPGKLQLWYSRAIKFRVWPKTWEYPPGPKLWLLLSARSAFWSQVTLPAAAGSQSFPL